jgi:hypothetical protein
MNLAGVAQAVRARLVGNSTFTALVNYVGYDKPQRT